VSVTSRWLSGAPQDSLAVALDRSVTRQGGRVTVEVVACDGRAACLEFRFRLETVEIWRLAHCCAVLDRDVLRVWLAAPGAPLVGDEVTLSLDRYVDVRGRVALTLPDVWAWTLSPTEEQALRDRV
jgi:hypothetical protein